MGLLDQRQREKGRGTLRSKTVRGKKGMMCSGFLADDELQCPCMSCMCLHVLSHACQLPALFFVPELSERRGVSRRRGCAEKASPCKYGGTDAWLFPMLGCGAADSGAAGARGHGVQRVGQQQHGGGAREERGGLVGGGPGEQAV